MSDNLFALFPIIVAIEKHFEDFNEDQFDFHAYCIRKVTLRSYVQLLRWEDDSMGNDVYADAAEAIIDIYLGLFDDPTAAKKLLADVEIKKEIDYSDMTSAERKKAKAQARKKKKQAEKKAGEQVEKDEKDDDATKDKKGSAKPKDDDPNGKELLKLDPLEEANKYTSTLVKNAPNRFSTWLYLYDVAIRRKKYFIALRALKKAKNLDNYRQNGKLFSRMVEFARLDFESIRGDNLDVWEVFDSEKSALYNGKSLDVFVHDVALDVDIEQRNLSLRVAVAKALTDTNAGNKKEACAIVTGMGLSVRGLSLESCVSSIAYLKSLGDDDENVSKARSDWIELAKTRFSLTNLF